VFAALPIALLLMVFESGKSLSIVGGGILPTVAARAVPMPNVVLLLIQIAVILLVSRLMGEIFKKIGQPQVVGEMVAGLLLGPSLLGWIAPKIYNELFPSSSLGFLNAISQVGVLIFMFLVGLELDHQLLRRQTKRALMTAHGSIAVPFVCGALLAFAIYPTVSSKGVPFSDFALFFATATSITAFPVLARILAEKKLLATEIGGLAMSTAAIADVVAWIILAAVIALVRSGGAAGELAMTIARFVIFMIVMLVVVRPGLAVIFKDVETDHQMGRGRVAILFGVIFVSAAATEWLGVHALFGAFIAGIIMPKHASLVQLLTNKLEDFTIVLLLPLFFTFTGLRTEIGLISDISMVILCIGVILMATASKVLGTAVSARCAGLSWKTSLSLGVFMNARGLMELIVLNVALDLKVISPEIFTIMVMMALVTTFVTGPFYDFMNRRL